MHKLMQRIALTALVLTDGWAVTAVAQTPEQQQMWDAQRVQALADEKARAEELRKARSAQSRSDGVGSHFGPHDRGRLGVPGCGE